MSMDMQRLEAIEARLLQQYEDLTEDSTQEEVDEIRFLLALVQTHMMGLPSETKARTA